VSPDIEVEHDPEVVRGGHDPQLERAVQEILAELAKNPPKKLTRPTFPKYQTVK
jgi:tricorn protease